MEDLNQIQEIVYENSEKFSSGDYLLLMNKMMKLNKKLESFCDEDDDPLYQQLSSFSDKIKINWNYLDQQDEKKNKKEVYLYGDMNKLAVVDNDSNS
jgi:hypothetical protein